MPKKRGHEKGLGAGCHNSDDQEKRSRSEISTGLPPPQRSNESDPKPGSSRSKQASFNITNASESGTEAVATISEGAASVCEESSSTPNPLKEILNIQLIYEEIFKNLSLGELLMFSVVDRLSNSCARTFLREKVKCLAVIRRGRMCRDLKDLDTLLEGSVNVPFNGLAIIQPFMIDWNHTKYAELDHHDHLVCQFPVTVYSNLLDQLHCKHVKVSMWVEVRNTSTSKCPGHQIFNKIMKDSASHLESLVIKELPYVEKSYFYLNKNNLAESIYSFLGIDKKKTLHCFPKLKSLEIPEESCYQELLFVKELVLSSPTTTELFGSISWKLVNFLLSENRIGAVREFDFEYGWPCREGYYFNEELRQVELKDYVQPQEYEGYIDREYLLRKMQLAVNFALTQPQLTKISISTFRCIDIDDIRGSNERLSRFFRSLSKFYGGILQRSSVTLQEITIYFRDFIFLIRMLEELTPPVKLAKLKCLTIHYTQRLEWTLQRINFYKWIPNLSSISFKCGQCASWRHLVGLESQFDLLYVTQEMCDRSPLEECDYMWPSVTAFNWDGSCRSNERHVREKFHFNEQLTKFCPNVRHVIFSDYYRLEKVCTLLWTEWPELESIAFVELNTDLVVNSCLDRVFTGMTKTECDTGLDALRSGLVEDARKIVEPFQTRASIRKLTKLKTFRFEFRHGTQECTSDLKVLLTESTKVFALELMPALRLTICRNTCRPQGTQCCYLMEHLEPCVTLSFNPEPVITEPPESESETEEPEPPVGTNPWESKPRACKSKNVN